MNIIKAQAEAGRRAREAIMARHHPELLVSRTLRTVAAVNSRPKLRTNCGCDHKKLRHSKTVRHAPAIVPLSDAENAALTLPTTFDAIIERANVSA